MMRQCHYGWVVVASVAAMLAIALGQLVNGPSVFFVLLDRELGWPRGSAALIDSVGLVGLALGRIAMGAIADRTRIRTVCLIGALAVGICVALAAGQTGCGSSICPSSSPEHSARPRPAKR